MLDLQLPINHKLTITILGTKSVQQLEKWLVSYSFKRCGSPAWARTTIPNGVETTTTY